MDGASPGGFLAPPDFGFAAGVELSKLWGVTLTPLNQTLIPPNPPPAWPLVYADTPALLREPPTREMPIFDLHARRMGAEDRRESLAVYLVCDRRLCFVGMCYSVRNVGATMFTFLL